MIYLPLIIGLFIGVLLRFIKKINIIRFINRFIMVIVFILVLLIGIVTGYTIMMRLSIIGIQTLSTLAIELTLLTIIPIAIGFYISLAIIRIGRVK